MEFITIMKVADLLPYREFDRVEKPAPKIFFMHSYTVDQVADYISSGAEIEPVELSVCGDKVLLTDGNHRIAAAKKLGMITITVKVVYYDNEKQLNEAFYDHTVQRFKQVA